MLQGDDDVLLGASVEGSDALQPDAIIRAALQMLYTPSELTPAELARGKAMLAVLGARYGTQDDQAARDAAITLLERSPWVQGADAPPGPGGIA